MLRLGCALVLAMAAAVRPVFPKEWGEEPTFGTMDVRVLPGGYGHGSSTLAGWIEENMKKDGASRFPPAFGDPPLAQSRDLRPLPFGYGMGSGTIAKWLQQKAKEVYGASQEEYQAFYGQLQQ